MCSPNCCQYNRTQGTKHRHLSKSGAQMRFPQKKKGSDERRKSCHRTPDTSGPKHFFPKEILSRDILHNMTAQRLEKKIVCFAKIWKPLRQDVGSFEDFATTLYGRQKPQSFVLQAAFKSLDQGKIVKDEIFSNTRSIKIVKKVKIKINFTEIFLDIGAVDKFYFLMYQRTI